MRTSIFLNPNAKFDAPIPRLPGEVSGVGNPPPDAASSDDQGVVAGLLPQATVEGPPATVGEPPPEPPTTVEEGFRQLVDSNLSELTPPNKDFVVAVAKELWQTTSNKDKIPLTVFADKDQAAASSEMRILGIAQEIGTWVGSGGSGGGGGNWSSDKIKALPPKLATQISFEAIPWNLFQEHALFRSASFWRNLGLQTSWLGQVPLDDPRLPIFIEAIGKPVDWATAQVGKAPLDSPALSQVPWEDVLWRFPWKAVNWSKVNVIDENQAIADVVAQLQAVKAPEPVNQITVQTLKPAVDVVVTQVETPQQVAIRLEQSNAEVAKLRAQVAQLEQSMSAQTPSPKSSGSALAWIAVIGVVGAVFYATVNMKKAPKKVAA